MRLLAIVLAGSLTASAQVQHLATNNDGSEVVFFSQWRPPGDLRPSGQQAQLLRYREGVWTAIPSSAGAGFPGLTGDGRVAYWIRSIGCGSCRSVVPLAHTEFSGLDAARLKIPNYTTYLSRNGRYALFSGYQNNLFPAVQDLETGATWEVPTLWMPYYPVQIADDGSIVGVQSRPGILPYMGAPAPIMRWTPSGGLEEIWNVSLSVTGLTLAAQGEYAVVQIATGESLELWRVHLPSRARQKMADLPKASLYLHLSADGRRALFYRPVDPRRGQTPAYVWDEATGVTKELDGAPEGVSSIALSHDGRIAWVATLDSRLLRYELDSETRTEVLPAFPSVLTYDGTSSPVPGSAVHLATRGPIPDGLRLVWDDLDIPILRRNGVRTTIQLPFELAARLPSTGNHTLVLRASLVGHPLQLPVELLVANRPLIRFETTPGDFAPLVQAFAGDTPITPERPALPGETIRIFLTGLGALNRDVPTGAPGPDDPPAQARTQIACALMGRDFQNPPWQGVEITPAIYAPGRSGLYQIDLRIPADWPAGLHNLACYRSDVFDRTDAHLPIGRPPQ